MPANAADDNKKTVPRPGFVQRLKAGLGKTRTKFSEGIQNVFLGAKELDDHLLEELETLLLTADVGVEATMEILDQLTAGIKRKELGDGDAVYAHLKMLLTEMLKPVEVPLEIQPRKPFVILMVGVNGVGKTTTIGKLAAQFQRQGRQVMLAAGDTFRAAAVEQLKVWGERNQVPVVAQETGSDSASVIYDAVASAQSKGADVLIADTAGRLQNKKNLMEELSKITRVMAKLDDSAPHEVILVLDAGTGQNAISQAKEFLAAVNVSSIILTKLDGTARGGVIFALARQLSLPIRYVGIGEQIDDLQPFSAEAFVDALLE